MQLHAHEQVYMKNRKETCHCEFTIKEGILPVCNWVVPENIHTHTTGGISEFRRGGGVGRLEF